MMRLAAFIRSDAERILHEWEEFVKTLRPGAALPRWLLRAYAAAILQSIADDVERPLPGVAQAMPSRGEASGVPIERVAAVHVDLRIESGFDLAQIIAEYRALRSSILRLWRASDPAGFAHGAEEMSRLTEAIDQAVEHSVSIYEEREARYRDRFLGMLGHDLRNPLNSILLGAVALSEAPDLSDRQRKTVERILGSVRRLDGMVGDILDFARGRLGSPMPIALMPINLGSALREIVEEVQSTNPGFIIDLRVNGELGGHWDPERLKQAVSNLLLNAIQHGSGNRVALTATGDEEAVVLEVHNDGPPIPREMLGTIFDPLVHGRNPDQNRTGLGLGLFIVNEIVSAHRGTIAVTSSAQAGTTFSVRLPRHPS
jgi:signal transduction histidine kinase